MMGEVMTRPNVTVRHMETASGGQAPNQFIIKTEEGDWFQSYKSLICFYGNSGEVLLDKNYWDYSSTTGRYRNQFLGENKAATLKKIKSGEYKLVDMRVDLGRTLPSKKGETNE